MARISKKKQAKELMKSIAKTIEHTLKANYPIEIHIEVRGYEFKGVKTIKIIMKQHISNPSD